MTADGLTFFAALIHSTTLLAFSVFANQLYKQFFEKESNLLMCSPAGIVYASEAYPLFKGQ